MQIFIANPRGFCAGVSRAIDIVKNVLEIEKGQVYVRHEVVHNKFVVNDLKNQGAIFVKELDEVPENSVVIFSAHGVSNKVEETAKMKNLKVYDATCPLVTKVHSEVKRGSLKNMDCILIGHKGHPEVIGTIGRYQKKENSNIYLIENIDDIEKLPKLDDKKLFYSTQTTLSLSETEEIITALKKKFKNISAPKKEDICYATTNRQNAVEKLAIMCDLILVVGSKNSSNSTRLKELAIKKGAKSYLIDDKNHIEDIWLKDIKSIGITAGASAPEILVQDVIKYLKNKFTNTKVINSLGVEEKINFPLPRNLKKKMKN